MERLTLKISPAEVRAQKKRANSRAWYLRNPERVRAQQNVYNAIRYATDDNYRLARTLRRALCDALHGVLKSPLADIGCSRAQLRAHLEKQFYSGEMTWDNYGEVWVVGYIRPLGHFDLTDRNQYLAACSWRNLQPLTLADFKTLRAKRQQIARIARRSAL